MEYKPTHITLTRYLICGAKNAFQLKRNSWYFKWTQVFNTDLSHLQWKKIPASVPMRSYQTIITALQVAARIVGKSGEFLLSHSSSVFTPVLAGRLNCYSLQKSTRIPLYPGIVKRGQSRDDKLLFYGERFGFSSVKEGQVKSLSFLRNYSQNRGERTLQFAVFLQFQLSWPY